MQTHCRMKLCEFLHERPRGKIPPCLHYGRLLRSGYAFLIQSENPFEYIVKSKQSHASKILSPAEKQLYSAEEKLF